MQRMKKRVGAKGFDEVNEDEAEEIELKGGVPR